MWSDKCMLENNLVTITIDLNKAKVIDTTLINKTFPWWDAEEFLSHFYYHCRYLHMIFYFWWRTTTTSPSPTPFPLSPPQPQHTLCHSSLTNKILLASILIYDLQEKTLKFFTAALWSFYRWNQHIFILFCLNLNQLKQSFVTTHSLILTRGVITSSMGVRSSSDRDKTAPFCRTIEFYDPVVLTLKNIPFKCSAVTVEHEYFVYPKSGMDANISEHLSKK